MKYSQEYVVSLFKSVNYILLSVYINTNAKLKYICDKGHHNEVSLNNFKNRNQRCPNCAGNKKYTFKQVEQLFTQHGYTLISTEYNNIQTPLESTYPNKHYFKTSFKSFRNGTRCKKCNTTTLKPIPKKLTWFEVKSLFLEKGCTIMSPETDYINQQSKLEYMCSNNHTTTTTVSNLKLGRSCGVCYGKLKLDQKVVELAFQKKGYTLLSKK